MKFAFGEFHLWYQVALSMVACGKVSCRARWGLHTHPRGLPSPLVPPRRQGVAGETVIQESCPAADFHLQENEGHGRVTHRTLRDSGVCELRACQVCRCESVDAFP